MKIKAVSRFSDTPDQFHVWVNNKLSEKPDGYLRQKYGRCSLEHDGETKFANILIDGKIPDFDHKMTASEILDALKLKCREDMIYD